MDAISLKKYIYENKEIEYVLESIGCHSIVFHSLSNYYSCANCDGDNKNAINVKNNEYLDVRNWTREDEFASNADIITLAQYNMQMSFVDTLEYLHEILELEFTLIVKNKKIVRIKDTDTNDFASHNIIKIDDTERKPDICTFDGKKLDLYEPLLHISWYRDGVMPWTRKKFGLAYSYRYKRVVIPLRYWATGEILGFNMRTTVEEYESLGISKYYITPSYKKSLNIYGLYEHYDDIKKAGYVVVYEAERSVLKRDSLLDCTGVALSGHVMFREQIYILISLNVDIIIAMDNDVDINEIRYMCEKFYGIRNVYYIYDKWNLLDKKDSIADKPKDFKFLMDNKVKYDAKEHREYSSYVLEKRKKYE